MPAGFVSFIAAFVLAATLTVILRRAAIRWSLVDIPDARKVHDGHVPLCGGLAIFSAFLIAVLLFGSPLFQSSWSFAIAIALLVITGAADDRWMLPVTPRLLVQFLAAVLLVVPGAAYPSNFGGFLADPLPSFLIPLAIVFALLFVVGMINATNMSDGADGLAGGLVAASLFWLALVARHLDRPNLAFLALLLLAAVVGFLAFNMRHPWRLKASVFMGDAGSVALGAAIGFLVMNLCSGQKSVSFFLLAWIIVVPATDMASLIVRRVLAGRSPMSADRCHLHHLLMDLGVPHAAAVGLILIISASCGALAWIAIVLKLPESVLVAGLIIPVAAHTLFVLAAMREIALRAGRAQPAAKAAIKIAASRLEGSGS